MISLVYIYFNESYQRLNIIMSILSDSICKVMYKYDVKFETKVPDKLTCIICKNVLKKTHQTECGCKACYRCIEDHLKNSDKCPSNSEDCRGLKLSLQNIHPDNATNKEIYILKVECVYVDCSKKVLLRDLITHMDSCEHRLVVCVKCNKEHVYNKIEDHNKNECLERQIQCEWCKCSMTYNIYKSKHLQSDNPDNICPEYKSYCPNDCSEYKGKLVKVGVHLSVCTSKQVKCPYGCGAPPMNSTKLNQHIIENAESHISKLIDTVNNLNKDIEVMKKDNSRYQTLINELSESQKQMSSSLISTTNEIARLEKVIKASGYSSLTSSTLESMEHSRSSPAVFTNSSYIWKINNFPQKQIESQNGNSTSITSGPFFTSEFGYKLCLRIYPTGDGVGRGTHLSVFFAIMKSDYDDLLSWPFKQKVTLSLLSQEDGTKNHSDTFKPDVKSACYQKPVDDCNVASGSPKFISLDMVKNGNSYCKHGNIFIKITVDQTAISRP